MSARLAGGRPYASEGRVEAFTACLHALRGPVQCRHLVVQRPERRLATRADANINAGLDRTDSVAQGPLEIAERSGVCLEIYCRIKIEAVAGHGGSVRSSRKSPSTAARYAVATAAPVGPKGPLSDRRFRYRSAIS